MFHAADRVLVGVITDPWISPLRGIRAGIGFPSSRAAIRHEHRDGLAFYFTAAFEAEKMGHSLVRRSARL